MAVDLWRGLLCGAIREGLLSPPIAEDALLEALGSVSHTDSSVASLTRVVVAVVADMSRGCTNRGHGGGEGGGGTSGSSGSNHHNLAFCRILLVARKRLANSPASHELLIHKCEEVMGGMGRIQFQPT